MPISHKHVPFQYSDYISPLPADELIKIGSVKQSLYNEGVEKVQKRIDELDKYGFQIEKPEDRQYFSQEMDKLIKSVNESSAKTDFSNMANVRSILSIGRPLENDPYILNAIEGSKELQRRKKLLSELKSSERSPANDWLFMNDAEQWYNDGKVGSKLSKGKQYTPYTDPSEYVSKIVNKVKPNIETDIIRENGFLKKEEREELAKQRLKSWMENNLPPQIVNQIKIDAEYEIRNADPAQMKNNYFNTAYKQLNQVEDMMSRLESLSSVTKEQQDIYKNLIIRKRVLEEALQTAPESDEEAKNLYLQSAYDDFITGQADLYAYKKEKKDWSTDAYVLANYNASIRKTEREEREKADERIYRRRREIDAEFGINQGSGGTTGTGGTGGTGTTGGRGKKETESEKARKLKFETLKNKATQFNTSSSDWKTVTAINNEEDANKKLFVDAINKALSNKNYSTEAPITQLEDATIEVRKSGSGHEFRVKSTSKEDGFIIKDSEFENALKEFIFGSTTVSASGTNVQTAPRSMNPESASLSNYLGQTGEYKGASPSLSTSDIDAYYSAEEDQDED